MLSKEVKHFVLSVGAAMLAGCGAGHDQIFEKYGIYYGVSPGGYIAAQYTAPPERGSSMSGTEMFRSVAQELDGVRRGQIPIRNGLKENLAKCETVTIVAIVVHNAGKTTVKEEYVGIISFPIAQLALVARDGPTAEMGVSTVGMEDKDTGTIAREEHARIMRRVK